jgi:hypothetical protein
LFLESFFRDDKQWKTKHNSHCELHVIPNCYTLRLVNGPFMLTSPPLDTFLDVYSLKGNYRDTAAFAQALLNNGEWDRVLVNISSSRYRLKSLTGEERADLLQECLLLRTTLLPTLIRTLRGLVSDAICHGAVGPTLCHATRCAVSRLTGHRVLNRRVREHEGCGFAHT